MKQDPPLVPVLGLVNPPGLFPGPLTPGRGSSPPWPQLCLLISGDWKDGWRDLLAHTNNNTSSIQRLLSAEKIFSDEESDVCCDFVAIQPFSHLPLCFSPLLSQFSAVASDSPHPTPLTLQMNAAQSCDVKIDRRFPLGELPHPLEGNF